MDPFDEDVLPFDVHEYILQHLNGADLLKASEVSRTWNEKVETTKAFMKKIKLSITSIPLRQGVTASQSISSVDKESYLRKEDIDAILNKQRNHENVEIKLWHIEHATHRVDLLKKFANSIVDFLIDLSDIVICIESKCEFPNLKTLRLGFSASPLARVYRLRELMAIMPKVEKLYLRRLSASHFNQLRQLPSLTSLREVRFRSNRGQYVPLYRLVPNISFIQEDW